MINLILGLIIIYIIYMFFSKSNNQENIKPQTDNTKSKDNSIELQVNNIKNSRYDFKKAYEYACNASIEELTKRATVYNAYISAHYTNNLPGTVAHDVMLTIIGAIYGPYGNLTSNNLSEINSYLKDTNRGFDGKWGRLTYSWFSKKFQSTEDDLYFNKMCEILMQKSDKVYEKLTYNMKTIDIYLLLEENFMSSFDNSNKYRTWKYV